MSRHQAQPCGKLAPVLEALGIAEAGHEGTCGKRAKAADALESLAVLVLQMPADDLAFELGDLPVESLELDEQSA